MQSSEIFGTMDSSSPFPSRPGPRETTPRRPLTKAARRDVRRRLALAAEMKVFSVSIDGVVWTLFHPEMRAHKPSSPDDPAGGAAQGSSASTISRRSERSAKRFTDFRKARRNWLAILFRQWKQLGRVAARVRRGQARTRALLWDLSALQPSPRLGSGFELNADFGL